ncbi:MAG TPA: hypothetical protein VI454_04185 [Verrucomicrobiae bacterium]
MPKIPDNIRHQLSIAEKACRELESIAVECSVRLKFTLDGRFVGDIGELIAAQHFDLQLFGKQQHCHDGRCIIRGEERGVQIKCRRKSTVIDFHSRPTLLLVIYIDEGWTSWETIYNGPGDFLSDGNGFSADEQGRLSRSGKRQGRRLNLEELSRMNAKLNDEGRNRIRVPIRSA